MSAVTTIALVSAAPAGGVITLTAAGATLSNFAPGKTATGSGALTATDTNLSWTLQAEDQGSGAGRMVAGATGCTGSDSKLKNPLQVSVTSALSGVTSAGQITLSSTNQTVASTPNQALAANVLTTSDTQVIPANEVMLTGCVYAITVT